MAKQHRRWPILALVKSKVQGTVTAMKNRTAVVVLLIVLLANALTIFAQEEQVTPPGMALIPAGSFQMGDSFSEGFSDERPVHEVYVSAFYMDIYEVTKALWDEVAFWAQANGYDIKPGDGSAKGLNHPVFYVSWYQVVRWANARSEKEGLSPCYTVSGRVYRKGESDSVVCNWTANGYRLPTEAEWEKAARGEAVARRYPWGDSDEIDRSRANYNNYYKGTTPVGSFAPNGYGLYDMAGNVAEWCWNPWNSGTVRPFRGGGYGASADECRVAYRVATGAGARGTMKGFRLVRRANEAPRASFTMTPTSAQVGQPVTCDASASYDPDGTITKYSWTFGDGTTGSGKTMQKTYSSAGTYSISLTVIDNDGAAASTTRTKTVTTAKKPPTASFTWQVINEYGERLVVDPRLGARIQFDPSKSSDSDGHIVSWRWDFGDGKTSFEQNPVHEYRDKRSHTVILTVTDDHGLTGKTSQTISIKNVSPQAQFTFSPQEPMIGLAVHFDASSSSDEDGSIATYQWDFTGDGKADATGPVTDWSYAEGGRYTVLLAVTDNDGAECTAEHIVTVAAAPEIVEPARVWALVIGISDYLEVNDLRYAKADAVAFTRWLLDSGVGKDNILLLLDEQRKNQQLDGVESQYATLTRVRAGLDWLRRMSRANDLVFVFFAGHGYQGEDDNGDETDGVDEFLVLHDTLRGAIEATSLRDDEFGQFLDRVQSDHVMVVFDSCYSGGQSRSLSSGTRPLPGTFDIFQDFKLEGKLVLAAAKEDQKALEDETLGHGVFTYFLLQGLTGKADLDSDYRITAEELFKYVSKEVERFAREQIGGRQTPQLTGRGTAGIVVGRTNRPPEASFDYCPQEPFPGKMVQFKDTSEDDANITTWAWIFADGSTSRDQHPIHSYSKPGSYSVVLTVTDDNGVSTSFTRNVIVGPVGCVVAISGDIVIVSLGSANGVKVGDRFEVVRLYQLSDGTVVSEHKATIEVTEIIGINRSACYVVEQDSAIEIHDTLVPFEDIE